ncbi:hypothetical protein, partial [Acidovorax soli]|uniref:hypothetical protein n=1 Tax=Acidovorax soli TaxID=592050 RepID=UPI001FCC39C3
RLQLEFLRVLRTHLLGFHSLTPCRYFQQGLRTPFFRGKVNSGYSLLRGGHIIFLFEFMSRFSRPYR